MATGNLNITVKRSGNALRMAFEGTVNRARVRGHTHSYMVGIDRAPDYGIVSELLTINKVGGGAVSTSARHKVVLALTERLQHETQARGNPMRRNPRTVFSAIDYVSGQEVSIDDAYRGSGFATVLNANFTIEADRLAKILGVQRRVLSRKLESLTESQAIYALTESKIGNDVLASFKAKAKDWIEQDVNFEADEPGMFRATKIQTGWPEDTEYFDVEIDSDSMSIEYDAEIEVIGDWAGRN